MNKFIVIFKMPAHSPDGSSLYNTAEAPHDRKYRPTHVLRKGVVSAELDDDHTVKQRQQHEPAIKSNSITVFSFSTSLYRQLYVF